MFDLLQGRWIAFPEGELIEREAPAGKQRKTSPDFTALVAAAEKLLQTVKSLEGRANKELRSYAEAIRKLTAKMEK